MPSGFGSGRKEEKMPSDQSVLSGEPILNEDIVVGDSFKENPLDDFERFRLSQDFKSLSGAKKLLTTVPVRKPNKQQFVRTRPEPGFVIDVMLLEYGESRDIYLIEPDVQAYVQAAPTRLILSVDRSDNIFIWPVKLPGEDGRQSNWHLSALEASELAKKKWVRVQANMSLGAYEIFEAQGELPEPRWPEEDFSDLLRIAFKNNIIDSPDHIVLRQLAGDV